MSEKPQTPANPAEAPEHHNELEDLKNFLQAHGKSILVSVIVVAVAYAAMMGYRRHRAAQADLASMALATSQSTEDLQLILDDYGSTPSAPSALLTLAGRLFQEARYDEAQAAYAQFRAKYPDHPMALATDICQAQVTEAAGNPTEAQAQFEAFVASHPDNYLVPLAQMGRARCLQQQGLLDEARTVYEDFLVEHTDGPWTTMAETNLKLVQRDIRTRENPMPSLVKAKPAPEAVAEPEPVVEPAAEPATTEPAAETPPAGTGAQG